MSDIPQLIKTWQHPEGLGKVLRHYAPTGTPKVDFVFVLNDGTRLLWEKHTGEVREVTKEQAQRLFRLYLVSAGLTFR